LDSWGESVKNLAELLKAAKRVVAFTGAGISTESGIPDYRGTGGVWERYRPVYFSEYLASHQARCEYWRRKKELYKNFTQSKPNKAHLALAELERMGKLQCLITQNIDGLHQDAGNSAETIIELHGTNRQVYCLECKKRYPAEEIFPQLFEGIDVPQCKDCGGWLKPATISFGQAMPEEETRLAEEYSRKCDLFMAIGSSLSVQPASLMPLYAKQSGARLAIINFTETDYDSMADVLINEKASLVLSQLIKEISA
jgi:NAD-dependent deacetylase